MQGVSGVSYSARDYFEQNVRKLGPGYQQTINGLANALRTPEAAASGNTASVHYTHVIDTYA